MTATSSRVIGSRIGVACPFAAFSLRSWTCRARIRSSALRPAPPIYNVLATIVSAAEAWSSLVVLLRPRQPCPHDVHAGADGSLVGGRAFDLGARRPTGAG